VLVYDGLNRAITINQPPTRIVSLFASNTELLAALGLANRIVGIEDYTVDLLGRAAGVPVKAQSTIVDLRARPASVHAATQHRRPLRVYLEIGENDRGALQTARAGTYTADALTLAGADNVFPGLTGITQVSDEAVIRANPEVILVARTDTDISRITGRPGWQHIEAVRNGRVYAIDRALLLGAEMMSPLAWIRTAMDGGDPLGQLDSLARSVLPRPRGECAGGGRADDWRALFPVCSGTAGAASAHGLCWPRLLSVGPRSC
jgi:ABC-type Fe3+-hydroxamate transport system substrate-binding protein